MAPAPLKIALVTRGKYDGSYKPLADDDWTRVRYRNGNPRPETFDDLDQLLARLIEES